MDSMSWSILELRKTERRLFNLSVSSTRSVESAAEQTALNGRTFSQNRALPHIAVQTIQIEFRQKNIENGEIKCPRPEASASTHRDTSSAQGSLALEVPRSMECSNRREHCSRTSQRECKEPLNGAYHVRIEWYTVQPQKCVPPSVQDPLRVLSQKPPRLTGSVTVSTLNKMYQYLSIQDIPSTAREYGDRVQAEYAYPEHENQFGKYTEN